MWNNFYFVIRMEIIKLTEKVRNGDMVRRLGEQRIFHTMGNCLMWDGVQREGIKLDLISDTKRGDCPKICKKLYMPVRSGEKLVDTCIFELCLQLYYITKFHVSYTKAHYTVYRSQ